MCSARVRQVESERAVYVLSRALYVTRSTDVGEGGGFSLVVSAAFLEAANTQLTSPLSLSGRTRSDVK